MMSKTRSLTLLDMQEYAVTILESSLNSSFEAQVCINKFAYRTVLSITITSTGFSTSSVFKITDRDDIDRANRVYDFILTCLESDSFDAKERGDQYREIEEVSL